jgi:hypothetical protein
MPNQITVFASPPFKHDIKSVRVDVCTFKNARTTKEFGIENGPYCYSWHHMCGKKGIRFVFKGPRGGEKARVYLSPSQAQEFASVLMEMVGEANDQAK